MTGSLATRSFAPRSFARDRCVSAHSSSSGRVKLCPNAASSSERTASTRASNLMGLYAISEPLLQLEFLAQEKSLSNYETFHPDIGRNARRSGLYRPIRPGILRLGRRCIGRIIGILVATVA